MNATDLPGGTPPTIRIFRRPRQSTLGHRQPAGISRQVPRVRYQFPRGQRREFLHTEVDAHGPRLALPAGGDRRDRVLNFDEDAGVPAVPGTRNRHRLDDGPAVQSPAQSIS